MSYRQEKKGLLDMGMKNLPDFFYSHYYRYPENVEELCYFIENHYEYRNNADEMWKPALLYLKKKRKKLNIISQRGLFLIFKNNHLSYNNKDICTTMALHSPDSDYQDYMTEINLYDLNGKNLKETIGIEKADSISNLFRKMKQNVYIADTLNFNIEKNTTVAKWDQRRSVLLEYSTAEKLNTFCPEEPLILVDYPFFERIDSICDIFCTQQDIEKMIFSTFVLKTKEN